MTKQFVLLIISVLILLLAGCDDRREEIDALEARLADYAQYDELIGYIENDAFDEAERLIEAYAQQHNNEQISAGNKVSVQITAENCREYFEICELTQWCENDLGETTGFITHVCVKLRDAYSGRLIAEECSVDFGWQAACSVKNCDVDTENRIVSIENVFGSKATTFGDPETLRGTFSFDGQFVSIPIAEECYVVGKIGEIVIIGEYSFEGTMKPVCFDYENVELTQAQGVLMLRG